MLPTSTLGSVKTLRSICFSPAFSASSSSGFFRERNDAPIRVNRAAFDVGDLPGALQKGETDRGQLLAFLGEHLNPRVKALIMHGIVGDLFDVEVHRVRPGALGSAVIFSSSSLGCWN